ncbi:MAG: polyphenol oxidase family protein [Deltaproteobacteria bacterium]|nr:polyphenol oxidase family protein [Deltaproteobacteria bacterium]
MLKREKLGLKYYAFASLERYPQLVHAVLTRHSPEGSDWTFSSSSPENKPEQVLQNFKVVEKALKLSPLIYLGQEHGDKCLIIPPSQQTDYSHIKAHQGYDAVIGFPGQSLMIRVADCQGAIIFDPQSQMLALVHSGWRGSVKNILGQTIALLKDRFSLEPKNFLAAFAPSLGACCGEFIHYQRELPQSFTAFMTEKPFHFDFPAISRYQLVQAGMREENIEFSGLCTKCSPDFYSYRRGDTGRFAVVAGVVN